MKTTSTPKVSVLISAYNVEQYIESSVQSIVDQLYTNLEIFVVDDGSADNTYKKIEQFSDPRIIHFSQTNKGKSATLNDLINRATGKYVVIHDSDDISTADRISSLVDVMEHNQKLALVMSGHALIINDKVVAPKSTFLSPSACKALVADFRLPAHDPTMMIKTEIAKETGFQEDLSLGEGVDFIFKIAEKYDISVVDKVLYQYRIIQSSITKRDSTRKAQQLFLVTNNARNRREMPPLAFDDFFKQNRRWLCDHDNNLSGHFTESSFLSVMSGKRIQALHTALLSLSMIPRGKRYAKPIAYALAPKFFCKWARKRFGS